MNATAGVQVRPDHARVRSRAIPQAWRAAIAAGLGCWLAFKVVSEVVALVAVYGAAFPSELRHNPGALTRVWDHWDTGWFTGLATSGYVALSHVLIPPGHIQNGAAFPPLLPMLIRVLVKIAHRSAFTSGIVITSAALAVALVGLYRLVALDFDARIAGLTLVLLLVFPASFIFNSVYSESLMLMACVWAVLMARLQHWALAGLFTGMAALSKIVAVLVVVVVLLEYLAARAPGRARPRQLRDLASILAPPAIALGGLMLYLGIAEHAPLAFITAQKDWNRGFLPIWVMVPNAVSNVFSLRTFQEVHGLVTLLDVVSLFFLAGLSVYAWQHVRRSYAVFMALSLLSIASAGYVESSARHVLLAFPVFIAAAVLASRRPWLERAGLVTWAPAWAYVLGRFVTGQWAG